ncbi:MAG: flippase-like domain-containing protein [Chloroflexi bacterium]|nr:flippase-like domain-containing protein [Chloroflexota bacterium]MCI0831992.1 flippase-like domain-containing protein [Chloroflexota bacterium]
MPFARYIAQLVFAAGLLGLLLWRTDLAAVRDELSGATLWWLPLAIVVNLLSDYFRAIRWRVFLRPLKSVGVRFLWGVSILGVACNLALPFRAGEVVRVQIVRRRTGLELAQVVATVISEKLMDTVAFSAFLVIGLLAFPEARYLWPLAAAYLALLVIGVIGARWLSSNTDGRLLPTQAEGRWSLRIAEQVRSFSSGLKAFRSKRSLLIVSACSVAAWVCEATMYWAAGQSIGLDLSPAFYLLLVVAATVAVSVPITQAGLGVYEVALTSLLVAFDVDRSQAVAFAIYAHAILAVPYLVVGPLAAIGMHIRPRDVFYLRGSGGPTDEEQAMPANG